MTIKQRFFSSIKRGTGEAHLLMKAHPEIDFSNEIIKAAIKNFAYDAQCEGSRADYIWELILLANQKEKIRKVILKKLATERKDAWALGQLFDLATLLAKEGDKESRKAIYKRFYKKIIFGCEDWGQENIVELDGWEGLKYIADVKGKVFQKNVNRWDDSFFVDDFQKNNPDIKVYRELEKVAETNVFIKTYLETIRQHKFSFGKRAKPKFNYEFVMERINGNSKFPMPRSVGKNLSKNEIKKIADDFLEEKDKSRQINYLRFFERVKFPYDYKFILGFAEKRNSSQSRISEFASGALKYFSGKDIRKLAIEKITHSNYPYDYLDLLISNYKKGDWKILKSVAEKFSDPDTIHGLACGFITIYKKNSAKECKSPLETIYNKLTCALHRVDILEILIQNKVLSKKIKKEMQFDSDKEIRKLFRNK
jgi:hypothetical protein